MVNEIEDKRKELEDEINKAILDIKSNNPNYTKRVSNKYRKQTLMFGLENFNLGVEMAIKEFIEILNEENINIANYYDTDCCEKCNKNISPSIHHFIDAFYKRLMHRVQSLGEKQ